MLKKQIIFLVILFFAVASGILFFLLVDIIKYEPASPPEIGQPTVKKETYGSNENCEFTFFTLTPENSFVMDPESKKEITCYFIIHPDIPEYIFRITNEKGKSKIEKVEILREKGSSFYQLFTGKDIKDTADPYGGRAFMLQDINFDGYSDVRTVAWSVRPYKHVIIGFNYWVFDPSSGSFKLDNRLTDLGDPEPNPATKEIKTEAPIFGFRYYKWINGELTRVR